MSCLRLNKIRNPKKDPTGIDKPFISVPDGRCINCKKTRTNDYLVRSYFEYLSNPDQDLYFVTLDYDDEHLPTYEDIPCFDYEHLKMLFHLLRDSANYDFRYMAVPDFGDAFERPHWHVIFYFQRGVIIPEVFWSLIKRYWKYGKHQNLRNEFKSAAKSPLAAVQYVSKYTTKDNFFNMQARIVSMPKRFRAEIHCSVGFGAQALDPSEFKSDRLVKEGLRFFPKPYITKEKILKGELVYLKLDDKKEVLTPFKIPRYYELKLMYDSSWDPVEKKQSLVRNADGEQLVINRHNADYNKYYTDFINSKYSLITSNPWIQYYFSLHFPSSPYNGMMWHDIVDDVLIDNEKFLDYLKIRDYLQLYDDSRKKFGFNRILPRPYWSVVDGFDYYFGRSGIQEQKFVRCFTELSIGLFIQATFIFDLWRIYCDRRKAVYGDWQMSEQKKARMREKCKKNPRYLNYLKRKQFDFHKLNPVSYVSFNPSREDRIFLKSPFVSKAFCGDGSQ